MGITTLGEKGQIVIPAEARAAMKLVKGEKLVVMNAHKDTLIVMKASRFEAMATHFTEHLASVKKMISPHLPRKEQKDRNKKINH